MFILSYSNKLGDIRNNIIKICNNQGILPPKQEYILYGSCCTGGIKRCKKSEIKIMCEIHKDKQDENISFGEQT